VTILLELQVIQINPILFYAAPVFCDLRVEKNHILGEHTVLNFYRTLKTLKI